MNKYKIRESNIELLRIVAMFFIVLHHLLVHGMKNIGYLSDSIVEISLIRQMPFIFLNAFTVVAVNCYVLISGYWGINPTKKKFFNLFAICVFYSLAHYLINALHNEIFSLKLFIFSLLPFSHHQGLWFVTCYIGLFLLSPLLNAAVCHLNETEKSTWTKVLGGLAIITFYFGYLWRTELNHNGYNLVNFIFLYMIGRFLNNKSKFYQRKYKKNFLLIVYLVCVFMIALLCMLLLIYNRTSEDLYYWAWRYNSPFIVVGAVALFLFFNSLRIRRIWINYIASSTFSVYLIHENIYASKYLYTHIRTSVEDMNFVTSIVYLLSLALLVFSGCIIIDIVRRLLFDMFNKIRKLSLTSLLQR